MVVAERTDRNKERHRMHRKDPAALLAIIFIVEIVKSKSEFQVNTPPKSTVEALFELAEGWFYDRRPRLTSYTCEYTFN